MGDMNRMSSVEEQKIRDCRTVGILGAGAIGSYLVMGLSEKYGDRLWVIADGDRKTRLETQGLCINERKYDLHGTGAGDSVSIQ